MCDSSINWIFIAGLSMDGFLGQTYAESKYYIVMYLLAYGTNLPYLVLVNYFYGKNILVSKMTLISSIVYIIFLFIFQFQSINLIPYALILSNLVLLMVLWKGFDYVK